MVAARVRVGRCRIDGTHVSRHTSQVTPFKGLGEHLCIACSIRQNERSRSLAKSTCGIIWSRIRRRLRIRSPQGAVRRQAPIVQIHIRTSRYLGILKTGKRSSTSLRRCQEDTTTLAIRSATSGVNIQRISASGSLEPCRYAERGSIGPVTREVHMISINAN